MRAALGFRLHTGWAALVATAQQRDGIEVLLRRRGVAPRRWLDSTLRVSLEGAEPAALVKRAAAGSQKTAKAALSEIIAMLRRLDVTLECAGIPTGSTQVPEDLTRILGAHPMIHAAEGALFQKADAATASLHFLRNREARAVAAIFVAQQAVGFLVADDLLGLRIEV